mmetsp:Transcript_39509/g.97165  ORF Transcript_39509/g.97165 Transcript_39509/m.97165 type:complete len:395 (-) Transcript_39509:351-1535(-)
MRVLVFSNRLLEPLLPAREHVEGRGCLVRVLERGSVGHELAVQVLDEVVDGVVGLALGLLRHERHETLVLDEGLHLLEILPRRLGVDHLLRVQLREQLLHGRALRLLLLPALLPRELLLLRLLALQLLHKVVEGAQPVLLVAFESEVPGVLLDEGLDLTPPRLARQVRRLLQQLDKGLEVVRPRGLEPLLLLLLEAHDVVLEQVLPLPLRLDGLEARVLAQLLGHVAQPRLVVDELRLLEHLGEGLLGLLLALPLLVDEVLVLLGDEVLKHVLLLPSALERAEPHVVLAQRHHLRPRGGVRGALVLEHGLECGEGLLLALVLDLGELLLKLLHALLLPLKLGLPLPLPLLGRQLPLLLGLGLLLLSLLVLLHLVLARSAVGPLHACVLLRSGRS